MPAHDASQQGKTADGPFLPILPRDLRQHHAVSPPDLTATGRDVVSVMSCVGLFFENQGTLLTPSFLPAPFSRMQLE